MDLFAGCGGISLGFASAGFELVASVELDKWAAESHSANLINALHGTHLSAHQKPRDITVEDPASIFRDYGLVGSVDDYVDVLVGGPPCQAFARVGRAKLRYDALRRNEGDAQIAHLVDSRVNLWERYLYFVRETKPLALLLENVPDILNHGGKNVVESIAGQLCSLGYLVNYTLLNASWFGVPQARERMFLVGVHQALERDPFFPAPTHYFELPSGYASSRATALKLVRSRNPSNNNKPLPRPETAKAGQHYFQVREPSVDDGLPPTTTAGEALADLPPIFALELLKKGLLIRGRKDPSQKTFYASDIPTTDWSRLMRQWPNFGTEDVTTGHVIRYLPRDYKFFRLMGEGWSYPDIWRFVEDKRYQLLVKLWNGQDVDRSFIETKNKEIIKDWTIPYDPNKFPNKWGKLSHDKPANTLLAHLGKDSYSHIHYDDRQARTISVREAARLQSFPDGFVFHGSMNPAFNQIGNAVPPLLAYALAMTFRRILGCRKLPDLREGLLGITDRILARTINKGESN
jgi:DNA (cytosine-5)-methyltransferase 1